MDSALRTYFDSGEFLYNSTFAIGYSLLSLVPGTSIYSSIQFISKAAERHIKHAVLELKIKRGWFVEQIHLTATAILLS